MLGRTRFLTFALAAFFTAVVAGCGGNSNPKPQGGFTAASLSGSYSFLFSGSDISSGGSAEFFAVAGSLQADGAGHITSGILDVNQNDSSGLPQPLTSSTLTGTYTVRADGRGTAILNSSAGNFNMDFVIISAQRALVTRFETSATGSGAMDAQTSSAFSTAALAGNFAFNIAGAGSTGGPLATAGSFTTDASGAITTGIEDTSDNGAIAQNVAINSGSIAVDTTGRATLTITSASGTSSFAAYVVDANHLKLVETDTSTGTQLAGEAFRQQGNFSNASLSGPFAFTLAGVDVTNQAAFAAGGVFNSTGTGTIDTGTMDLAETNLVPGITDIPIDNTSTYSFTGLRGTLTLSTSQGTFNFAIYPTTSGVQALEIDSGFVVSGAAFPQSGTFANASISGTYGMNFTSGDSGLDTIASLKADGAGNMSGIVDINQLGAAGFPSAGTSLTANYSIGADGRGPFNISTGLGPQSMAVYVVDSSRALFIEIDGGPTTVGVMEHQ